MSTRAQSARPERRFRLKRVGVQLVVVAVGLGVGLGANRLLSSSGRENSARRAVPSVTEFAFPAISPPARAASSPAPDSPLDEPADPVAAVAALLRSEQERRPEVAWALLDGPGRARFPTRAAWARARSVRSAPVGFDIAGAQPAPDGGVDVTAVVTSLPSLDPFGGLVTAQTEVVWRAHREGDAWRVAAEPEATTLRLPADDSAPATVGGWVSALSKCDVAGARAFQAVEHLYGPADLTAAPCQQRGDWTVGAPAALSTSSDTAALQAAFGADVASWARVVPVRGGPGSPGSPGDTAFLAALAPFGDGWRVMGVTAAS